MILRLSRSQKWHDDYLTWNPSEWEGIREVIIPPTEIWLPDFGLENRQIFCGASQFSAFVRFWCVTKFSFLFCEIFWYFTFCFVRSSGASHFVL